MFFGWEYSYRGTDLLTYGLDPEWLHAHPEIMDLTMNQYCDLVREHGGFIAQAHPFREDFYIDLIRLLPRKVDAVEVINICRSDFENTLADQYADNYNLLKIAGSDNHVGYLDRFAGLELPRRATDIHDLIEAVKQEMPRFLYADQNARWTNMELKKRFLKLELWPSGF